VRFRYDFAGARSVKESKGPSGRHRTVYVDRVAEERDGELLDYVFAGDRRVARLGGKKPAPVAAGVMRWLGAVPGAFAVLAALALVTRWPRRWPVPPALPSSATTLHTRHAYDALGRRVRSVVPDGSPAELRYGPMEFVRWDAGISTPRRAMPRPPDRADDRRGTVEVWSGSRLRPRGTCPAGAAVVDPEGAGHPLIHGAHRVERSPATAP
jgi:hypothetical protein